MPLTIALSVAQESRLYTPSPSDDAGVTDAVALSIGTVIALYPATNLYPSTVLYPGG